MKTILQYGQAKLAAKKASTLKNSVLVAVSAGDALREGYKLKGYIKQGNGVLSYWRKEHSCHVNF